jgi:hypothetical protein
MPVICNLNATTGAVYSQFTETAHKLDCFSEIFLSNFIAAILKATFE